jgi:protein O-mannosyl-transferase
MFSTPKQQKFLLALILCAITLIIYKPVKEFDFINYDDDEYVTENYTVQSGLHWENIKWAMGATKVSNWHPLTWMSHMLDCHLYGMDASKHHWMNLMLHIVNVLLLFYVLNHMTNLIWPSAIIAALFALHPLNIQSVAWVAERKNLLSTTFWILGMWSYMCYARSDKQKLLWYLAVVLSLALGLMSKPMLVTLPCVFLLLDYWPLKRFNLEPNVETQALKDRLKPLFILVLEKIPFFLMVTASSIITYHVQKQGGAVLSAETMSLLERIKVSIVSYWVYIYKMIYPTKLSIYYPYTENFTTYRKVLLSALVLILISMVVIRLRNRYRYLVVGWLWYLGTLVPVIGIVKAGDQAYADRYAYVPLIGLFLMVVLGGVDLIKRWPVIRYWITGVSLVVLVALAINCSYQLRYWRNSITIFEHAVNVTENNKVALSNLGVALMHVGELDRATVYLEAAKRINSNFMANLNVAAVLILKKQYDQAIPILERILPYPPSKRMAARAHFTLGEALHASGRDEEALIQFQRAIEANPEFFEACNNLGAIFFKLKQFDEASKYFLLSIEIWPNANSYYNLCLTRKAQGRMDEAEAYYQIAVKLDPGFAEGGSPVSKPID